MKRIVSHTSEELKAIRARGESKTDWERVRRDSATDAPVYYDPEVDPYDPNDAAAVEAYWASAKIIRGPGRPRLETPKKLLPIRYDLSIIEAFKATGKGWQTRMNDALRTYLEEHPLNQA